MNDFRSRKGDARRNQAQAGKFPDRLPIFRRPDLRHVAFCA
jgi:hypothetical protein